MYDRGQQDTGPEEIPTEDMERLHDCVDQLPEELREVFEKSFYFGMTQEEIANDIKASVRTVKRRWRDAKLELQQVLDGGDPS